MIKDLDKSSLQDREIDALWNRLIGSRPNPSALEIDAGNMLLALKANRDQWRASAEAAEKLLKAASHALRSYQYDNGSPELAQSIADACDAALEAKP